MDTTLQLSSSLYAAIIGDALGVPADHTLKTELSFCALKNTLGFGRYDEPEGTWSDDTSLMLCTMESLSKGYNLQDIGRTFCKWLFEAYQTSRGYVFDAGLTTFVALENFRSGKADIYNCGCSLDDDNGNGSLVRILPAALCFRKKPISEFLQAIHDISQITHAHPRAKMACGIYSLIVKELVAGADKATALKNAAAVASEYYRSHSEFSGDISHFSRIFSGSITQLNRKQVSLSGYVVDTLESSLWCFCKYDTTADILRSAVELGLDYDTSSVVAGGLAGLMYGIDDLPPKWLSSLARKSDIDALMTTFIKAAL